MSVRRIDQLILKSVLETSTDQLAIVGGTLPIPISQLSQIDIPHPNTTDKPLQDLIPKEQEFLKRKSGRGGGPGGAKATSARLLASDINYVQNLLQDTLDEISENGTFSTLAESVAKSSARESEKDSIRSEEKQIRGDIAVLKRRLDTAQHKLKAEVQRENLDIAKLKDKLMEARKVTHGEEDYIQELEMVRMNERTKVFNGEEKSMISRRDE